MLRTSALAALMATASSVVYAGNTAPAPADPVIAQPIEASKPFWAGAYAGGQIGYAYSDFDLNLGTRPGDFNDDSVIGGIHAGYLWQVGQSFYIGPEFQYDFADLQATDATTGATASFDNIARLKLVAGYEVGNGLIYGSGGIAYADFSNVGTVFSGFDGGETNYVLGLGYDHRIGDNWSVGAEYQFHRFNSIGASGEDVDLNTVHLKAAYRF